jgi:sodium/pantothenate symporter
MIFAAGVICSFLIYLVIGTLVGRRVKDRSDYYVAGRAAPTILVSGTLVASFLSTVAFMGEVGFAYDGYAVLMLVLTPLNASGYVIGVLLFGRYLRRSEVLTVPEFFGKRFDSRALQAVAGGTVLIGIGAYLIAVTQGMSLLLEDLIGVNFGIALLVVWVAYTVFTLISGSPGVLINDTIMFFIFMVAGVLGMLYLIGEAGGPSAVMSELANLQGKPGILSPHGVVTGPDAAYGSPAEAVLWAVTLGIVWATIVAVSPWQSSRYLMAKNEHVSIRSGFVAMICVLFLYIFLMLGGATINLFNPEISPSEIAFIWAAQNVLPTWLGVIVITGIVAAGLSSAAAFLALIGFSAAHDIAPTFVRTQRDERAALRFSRAVMLALGLVVLVVTFFAPPAVFTIGYFAATLFAASWGPVAILSIYSERVTARGAIAGMVAGFVTVFVLQGLIEFAGVGLPIWADPVILGFAASFLGIFVGSIGQRQSDPGLDFRRSIITVPKEDLEPSRVRSTGRIALVTAALSVGLILTLFLIYYFPYSQSLTAST